MSIAFLVQVIFVLIIVGLLLWCVQRIPGLPAPIPAVISILVVLAFCVWLANASGVLSLR